MAVGTQPRSVVPVAAVATSPAALRRRFTPQYWAGLRFLVFGRAVPGFLFGWMGWIQVNRVIGNASSLPPAAGVSTLAARVIGPALYALFCCIPAIIYLTRPMPKARDGRLVARGAAFSGTLMQLAVGTFIGTGPVLYALPPFMGEVTVFITVGAFCGALWSLAYLRRSLSIIPEARRLSTGGPYRLVRHPLYFFEISAAVGVIATAPGVVQFVSFFAFVALQMTRARFEERLLASTFTEYADYARRTRRLIPFVW